MYAVFFGDSGDDEEVHWTNTKYIEKEILNGDVNCIIYYFILHGKPVVIKYVHYVKKME